jgi:hypothetical protein
MVGTNFTLTFEGVAIDDDCADAASHILDLVAKVRELMQEQGDLHLDYPAIIHVWHEGDDTDQ